jgi:hypothetical protein
MLGRWNIRRGLIRAWVLFVVGWLSISDVYAECPLVEPAMGVRSDTFLRQPAWELCLSAVADRFAPQAEPARTVVDAVFATCMQFERAIRQSMGEENCPAGRGFINALRDKILEPKVLARVMAARAARKQSLKAVRPPAIDYNEM